MVFGLESGTQCPSWVQIQHQSAGCDCAGSSQASSASLWLENNKGRSWGKRGGKKSFQWLALPGSNHDGGKKSRPLKRQPVRERWEGARDSTGCSFHKTHTNQLVSLAASFLLIPACRSQIQSELEREGYFYNISHWLWLCSNYWWAHGLIGIFQRGL